MLLVFLLLLVGGAIVNVAVLTGCQAKQPAAQRLVSLEPGLQRLEVERRLGQEGVHQATAAVDGACIVVTTHALDPWLPLYYVYRDDRLEKIVEAGPGKTYASSFEGTPWVRPLPDDSEKRLAAVLEAPALNAEAIADRIAEREREQAYAKQFLEPSALWPAVIITAPLYPLALPRILRENELDRELAAQFDPWKVRLGMTVEEVDAIYGTPKATRDNGDMVVRAYGEHAVFNGKAQPDFSWIAVNFKDGRATRVFSHGFFDGSLMTAPRKTYEDGT